ncbi:hypothetical protein ABN702_18035 [Bacillus haimaensis]|uniref:hypothetical protein n=1 Tax=Bacillus haimaensis TaxID=3160967 RepID=UPI003AA967B7
MNETKCPKGSNTEFAQGTDYMGVRPLDKKFSAGSQKFYTFCLKCGEVVSTRIENPSIFRNKTSNPLDIALHTVFEKGRGVLGLKQQNLLAHIRPSRFSETFRLHHSSK